LNSTAERLTGWSARDAVGREVGELLKVAGRAGRRKRPISRLPIGAVRDTVTVPMTLDKPSSSHV